MMSKDNGGPAFSLGANEYSGTGPEYGMTLRDYFAANTSDQEISDIMVLHVCPEWKKNSHPDTWSKPKFTITRQCARFIHAEIMLAERAK